VSGLSCPALFLYENNFSSLNFPLGVVDDNLCLAFVLALLWKVFGCSLLVSHIFFTLIGIALIYNLYKICSFFISDKKFLPYVFLLVISDAALVTQSLLLMTDTVMLLFVFMSVNYMLRNQKIAFTFSLLGLSLIRARGFDLCIGIGLSYFIILLMRNNRKQPFCVLINAIIPFIPAIIAYCTLVAIRSFTYNELSISRKDPAWSDALSLVNLKGFVKNIITMGRYFLETGRCFVWCMLIFCFVRFMRHITLRRTAQLWALLVCSLIAIIPITLFVQNTMGERYFIFQYLLISLITGLLLFSLLKTRTAKITSVFLIICLWTGNLWHYPENISTSWDTTLAHIPYYNLRKQMLQYVDENNINYKDVAAFFPATRENRNIDLSDDNRCFAPLDLKNNKYVFYSNIGNFDDKTIETLKQWPLEKEFRKGFVFIKLYINPLYVTNSSYSGESRNGY
jgi:uncharacterized membrane protein YuzA (DUF378 family)